MGRLKQFERRQEREAAQNGPAMYSHAIRCAMPDCTAKTSLGFEGKDPVPIAVFFEEGWMAIPDGEHGVVAFVCQDCYQKESARPTGSNSDNSEVSG